MVKRNNISFGTVSKKKYKRMRFIQLSAYTRTVTYQAPRYKPLFIPQMLLQVLVYKGLVVPRRKKPDGDMRAYLNIGNRVLQHENQNCYYSATAAQWSGIAKWWSKLNISVNNLGFFSSLITILHQYIIKEKLRFQNGGSVIQKSIRNQKSPNID